VEKAVSRIKIFRQDAGLDSVVLDCVVAGPGTLEAIPLEWERSPRKSEQRYFAATVLSEGRIAVFDFEYAAIRIFGAVPTANSHSRRR